MTLYWNILYTRSGCVPNRCPCFRDLHPGGEPGLALGLTSWRLKVVTLDTRIRFWILEARAQNGVALLSC